MKVAYVTAQAPFGRQETFVIAEMLAAAKLGVELVIVPRSSSPEAFHRDAHRLVEHTLRLPLISWRMAWSAVSSMARPALWGVLRDTIRHSRSLRILTRNLAVLPKAVHVSRYLARAGVEHIHAHWGSTPSTLAWAIARLTGIPWSLTVHRWDIAVDNMLAFKVSQARFVRCIAEDARKEVLRRVGSSIEGDVRVLHLGVWVPETIPACAKASARPFVFASPGNLNRVKGHDVLLEACRALVARGVTGFRCWIIGDGPRESALRTTVQALDLEEWVVFMGRIPHERLLGLYGRREVDAVVLPSVAVGSSGKEGIPVTLMESMAWGVPVISTDTGGTRELVGDGAGMIVKQRDPEDLADAMERLMTEQGLREELSRAGRARVREQFDVVANTGRLVAWMKA